MPLLLPGGCIFVPHLLCAASAIALPKAGNQNKPGSMPPASKAGFLPGKSLS
ncbi:hypothetical protein B4135_3317 [Caldibacillus debilis]|uniref:Uncharacterized protein n=1 Tax=Caldibacillus debilis TaxID=301148 RepID=A0A150LHI8_9BACI|nr:hypothetical protein B4135_3317 [Caldibacillus debilis]